MNNSEENSSNDESFEDLLKMVGTLGRRNVFILSLLAFTGFATGLEAFSYGFLGKTPSYHCQNEFLQRANWTLEQKLNISTPRRANGKFRSCEVFDAPYETIYDMPYEEAKYYLEQYTSLAVIPCEHREFENSIITTVTQWDLVCERRALYSTTASAVQMGKLLGSAIFGFMSDRYGRKFTYSIAVIGFVLASLSTTLSSGIWMFIILRVIAATFGMGIILTSFVLKMESILINERSMVSGLSGLPWSLSFFYLAAVAYFVRTWYYLQICLTLPCVVMFYAIWVVPESARWLIINQRYEEAYRILKISADSNQRVMSEKDDILKVMNNIHMEHKASTKQRNLAVGESTGLLDKFGGYYLKSSLVLMLDKRYRTTTLAICYCWFAVALVYYGISLGSPSPGTAINAYAYLAIGGVTEITSSFVAWYMLANFGRKKSMNAFYIACAASIFTAMILIIVEKNLDYVVLQWGLFVIGRLAIGGAFTGVFLYTAELYPTSFRTKAVGDCSIVARISSIFSSYINDLLGQVFYWGPSALFGTISALAVVAIAGLPETRHRELPDFTKRKEKKSKEEHIGFRPLE